jgi:APA family basic amino acid/polyamine antiporter
MNNVEIPEIEWQQFCESFTRQHHGWRVSVRQIQMYVVVTAGGVLGQLPARAAEIAFPADAMVWTGIVAAAFLTFYSFIGFEDMVTLAEEVKDVRRTLPAAVVMGLLITIGLYVAVSTVAVLAVPPQALVAARTPLASVVASEGQGEPRPLAD